MPNLRTVDVDQAGAEPVRSWLVTTLLASRMDGCPDCCCGAICAEHAADAVLDAARREDLIVLPADVADQIIEAAREQGRMEVRRG